MCKPVVIIQVYTAVHIYDYYLLDLTYVLSLSVQYRPHTTFNHPVLC